MMYSHIFTIRRMYRWIMALFVALSMSLSVAQPVTSGLAGHVQDIENLSNLESKAEPDETIDSLPFFQKRECSYSNLETASSNTSQPSAALFCASNSE